MAEKTNPEDCPSSKDGRGHCRCWWDCDPCCWCGADEPNPDCDCPRHSAEMQVRQLGAPGEAAVRTDLSRQIDAKPDASQEREERISRQVAEKPRQARWHTRRPSSGRGKRRPSKRALRQAVARVLEALPRDERAGALAGDVRAHLLARDEIPESVTALDVALALGEIRLRAERRIGEMLGETVQHEGGRPENCAPRSQLPEGVSRKQSSNWQRIARIPEERFEEEQSSTLRQTTNVKGE